MPASCGSEIARVFIQLAQIDGLDFEACRVSSLGTADIGPMPTSSGERVQANQPLRMS